MTCLAKIDVMISTNILISCTLQNVSWMTAQKILQLVQNPALWRTRRYHVWRHANNRGRFVQLGVSNVTPWNHLTMQRSYLNLQKTKKIQRSYSRRNYRIWGMRKKTQFRGSCDFYKILAITFSILGKVQEWISFHLLKFLNKCQVDEPKREEVDW